MSKISKWLQSPLSEIKPGETVIIQEIKGDKNFITYLLNIGLSPGNVIRIISGSKKTPYVVDFAGSKIALTWSTCTKIIVRK